VSEAALAGVRVLDLSERIAGPYCAKLFADLGADVIKIEPQVGDTARRMAPFVAAGAAAERSALFLHLNTNKRGAVLDVNRDRDAIAALARGADILIESAGPGILDRAGLGYGDLERANPGLVVTSITNFGLSGPYRDWLASDLVLNALNGMMYMNGEEHTPPVKLGLSQAQYIAGAAAAVATLAAHRFSRLTGQGQQIDCSLFEPMLNSVHQQTARYSYWGAIPGRPWYRDPPSVLECADGFLFAPLAFFRRQGVVEALGMPEEMQSERYRALGDLDPDARRERTQEMREIAIAWLRAATSYRTRSARSKPPPHRCSGSTPRPCCGTAGMNDPRHPSRTRASPSCARHSRASASSRPSTGPRFPTRRSTSRPSAPR